MADDKNKQLDFKIVFIILSFVFCSGNICIPQSIDLKKSIGDTLVVHGNAKLYHDDNLDLDAEIGLNDGDLIKVLRVDGDWIGILQFRTNHNKSLYLDETTRKNVKFEKYTSRKIQSASSITKKKEPAPEINLTKRIESLEERVEKLEKKLSGSTQGLSGTKDPFEGGPSDDEIKSLISELQNRGLGTLMKVVDVIIINKQKEGMEYTAKAEYIIEYQNDYYDNFTDKLIKKGYRYSGWNVYYFGKRNGNWVIHGKMM